MNQNKFGMMGWLVAAALAGTLFGSGFQGAEGKMGVVDIAEVVEKSELGKKNQSEFQAMKAAREGVLEFIDQYRVLTLEQATKLRDLSLKPNATTAEKAELERIKAEVIASDKNAKALSVKANLTPEERTLIQEYAQRSQKMEQTAQMWYREFTNEMQSWADKQKSSSIESARTAIQEVAKQQGFTVVFESGIAPYGANNITEAALKALNAKK
jgi:Skp family chaperone for outer membrane proteins